MIHTWHIYFKRNRYTFRGDNFQNYFISPKRKEFAHFGSNPFTEEVWCTGKKTWGHSCHLCKNYYSSTLNSVLGLSRKYGLTFHMMDAQHRKGPLCNCGRQLRSEARVKKISTRTMIRSNHIDSQVSASWNIFRSQFLWMQNLRFSGEIH